MLARNLLKNCANLVFFIKKVINSDHFINQSRQNPTDFIRTRKLPFPVLILFLINLVKGSYQDELDHFFKALFKFDVAQHLVTKAALAKARMKIKFQAFIDLNAQLIDYFYMNFKPIKWKGFTLLAIDGTTVQLPRIDSIMKHFGAWNPRQGDACPMARVSQMFDPLNRVTVDARIDPKSIGERELAAFHCLKLVPGDLLLLDRGYPAYWLFNLILAQGADFCARIQVKRWKVVRKFYNSGKKEKIISLPASYSSNVQCQELGLDLEPLKLRLIRVELETGGVEILVTSLIDQQTYAYDAFDELFHLRWPVEEDYKTMKQWVEIENFTGKSVLSIYQDFHARVFSKNFTSVLAFPTQPIIDQNTKNRKYKYKPNFAQALSKIKDVLPLLFIRAEEMIGGLISHIHSTIIQTIEPVRNGRTYPRVFNNRTGRFHTCYKPVR